MSYSSFEPSATKLVAEHFANGLFALTTGTGISSGPRELDRQMIAVLSTPHRSRCGNSSRAVNSYDPLGGESGSLTKAEAARSSTLEWSEKAREIASCSCVSYQPSAISGSLHKVTAAVRPFSASEQSEAAG